MVKLHKDVQTAEVNQIVIQDLKNVSLDQLQQNSGYSNI